MVVWIQMEVGSAWQGEVLVSMLASRFVLPRGIKFSEPAEKKKNSRALHKHAAATFLLIQCFGASLRLH